LNKEDKEYLEEKLLSGYENLLDINVNFIAQLGTTTISIGELLKLTKGSVIDLEKPAGESVELFVNNKILAKAKLWFMKRT
jgi:flagellar motor switch protein FliN/FliY